MRCPKNLDVLSPEDRRVVEEEIYRLQLIRSHGYFPGDERLKSGDRVKEFFG